ncbi:glycosyltransferase [Mesoterricola sediminis]|uniref:Glycosyltransferase n=1 Tax=Mesoterricola sediminis TaxID=2927980 RepID=A0AA48GLK4_9BACT|nr:glycosyltransferase family 4 protein [Mesoterricola sediminis]BDU75311.1 hypothetical protein METESE_02690 [Mesoterricola sediminis]
MSLRIVHVVAHGFLPPHDGGRLKAACLATALARCGDLHWVSLDDDHRARGAGAPPAGLDLPWGGSGTWHGFMGQSAKRRPFPRSVGGWLRAARAGVRLPLPWMPYSERHGEVQAALARLRPDLVVADETLLAPFAAFAPAKWRVVHTHNHDAALLAQEVFAAGGRGHQARAAARLVRIEREIFPRLDQVWGVREADLEAYRAGGVDGSKLFLAPNVIPDPCFLDGEAPLPPGRAVFFGSLWYPPNQDALAWLLDLWPPVAAALPGARLTLAGRGCPGALEARVRATPGLDLAGFVPDLASLLRASGVAVIPLRAGGGTKIKTLEAMAAGLPILATSVAAEGLGLRDGEHAVIRDEPEAFREALAAMLREPGAWRAMGLRARDLARERFSQAALDAAVGRAVDALRG